MLVCLVVTEYAEMSNVTRSIVIFMVDKVAVGQVPSPNNSAFFYPYHSVKSLYKYFICHQLCIILQVESMFILTL
jgi:hypothetical protein